MKVLGFLCCFLFWSGSVMAQQPASPSTSKPATCLSQYSEAAALSPGLLISTGFEIKAAVPGGLWLQKDKEVFFCNSGRAGDGDVICWKLRVPVKGQPCQ